MKEFIHAMLMGMMIYIAISLKYRGEYDRQWKFLLAFFVAFMCVVMLLSDIWSGDALFRTFGFWLGFASVGIVHYYVSNLGNSE